jgi:hypothetical protein
LLLKISQLNETVFSDFKESKKLNFIIGKWTKSSQIFNNQNNENNIFNFNFNGNVTINKIINK